MMFSVMEFMESWTLKRQCHTGFEWPEDCSRLLLLGRPVTDKWTSLRTMKNEELPLRERSDTALRLGLAGGEPNSRRH